MNYIVESSGRKRLPNYVDNTKDYPELERSSYYISEREGILRNELPRRTYEPRRSSRGTLRNEEPMAERYLRKEVTPISSPSVSEHMKHTDKAGLGWDKTHFILAIDSGCKSSILRIAEMKRKWGQIISGVQSWLSTLEDKEVLISFFTYDSISHNVFTYKTPEELLAELNRGIEASGEMSISLPIALKSIEGIISREDASEKIDSSWLHYVVLMTVTDFDCPYDYLNDFIDFKKRRGIIFFFNAIIQIDRVFEMTKVTTALEGVQYSIKKGANYTTAFIEALEKDPFKDY